MKLRALLLALLSLAGCQAELAPNGRSRAPSAASVLIFSHTTGYRHASIEDGIAAVRSLAEREGYSVFASEDPAVFSTERLRGVDAIVLLSSTTDPRKPGSEWLTGERRTALQQFVRASGAIVAVHAAADSHYSWPWFGQMIGGRFQRHPEGTPQGRVHVVDDRHPSTARLPAAVSRTDEWYYFDDYDPTGRLLVTLDPTSIGEADVNPNPVSWAREFEGGRIFYTAMGHTPETYREPFFLEHLAGGMRWALAGRKRTGWARQP